MSSSIVNLISHGRAFGPLLPTPDILINLTHLPNPPVKLRKSNLGTSKRLQKELYLLPAAQDALAAAMERIEEALQRLESARDETAPKQEVREHNVCENEEQNRTQNRAPPSHEMNPIPATHPSRPIPTLTVGIQCLLGHHRSVAIAEELARRLKSKTRTVDVSHRDLHRKRGG